MESGLLWRVVAGCRGSRREDKEEEEGGEDRWMVEGMEEEERCRISGRD